MTPRGVLRPVGDIAILDVGQLAPTPLTVRRRTAKTGADVVVMGISGGATSAATPAGFARPSMLSGPTSTGTRMPSPATCTQSEPDVEQGNSGRPLIDLSGHVPGCGVGAAVDDADTGFVLTTRRSPVR